MAGKGTEVGRTFEELAAIIDKVERKDRMGAVSYTHLDVYKRQSFCPWESLLPVSYLIVLCRMYFGQGKPSLA